MLQQAGRGAADSRDGCGGTLAVSTIRLQSALTSFFVCNRGRRRFPRAPQSHEASAFVQFWGAMRQELTDSTETLVFGGNPCGLGSSSEARKLRASSALGAIESVTPSL